MSYNKNSGYGQMQALSLDASVAGKIFIVAANSSGNNYNRLQDIFPPDPDGVVRVHTTPTLALAECTAGNADVIYIDRSYTTAMTEVELESAATKGTSIIPLLPIDAAGNYITQTNIATLPQTGDASLFTVTGKVKILQLVGEVTTVIQTQANNTLVKHNPTVGSKVDMCAALDISADADGSLYTISGTVGDALINTASAVAAGQALPLLLTAGVIELECAASNTGAIKWTCVWEPVDPGAMVIAA